MPIPYAYGAPMLRAKEAVRTLKEYHPPLGNREGLRLDFNLDRPVRDPAGRLASPHAQPARDSAGGVWLSPPLSYPAAEG